MANEDVDTGAEAAISGKGFDAAKAKRDFEIGFMVPNMIANGRQEVTLWLSLAKDPPSGTDLPSREDQKRHFLASRAIGEVMGKVKSVFEYPEKVFADVGMSVVPSEIYFDADKALGALKEHREPLLTTSGAFVEFLGRAAEACPDKTLFKQRVETPATDEEREVRAAVFEAILNESSFAFQDALTNSGNDQNRFGERIAPAVVRAFEIASAVAAKYPDKKAVEQVLATQSIYKSFDTFSHPYSYDQPLIDRDRIHEMPKRKWFDFGREAGGWEGMKQESLVAHKKINPQFKDDLDRWREMFKHLPPLEENATPGKEPGEEVKNITHETGMGVRGEENKKPGDQ